MIASSFLLLEKGAAQLRLFRAFLLRSEGDDRRPSAGNPHGGAWLPFLTSLRRPVRPCSPRGRPSPHPLLAFLRLPSELFSIRIGKRISRLFASRDNAFFLFLVSMFRFADKRRFVQGGAEMRPAASRTRRRVQGGFEISKRNVFFIFHQGARRFRVCFLRSDDACFRMRNDV